MLNVGLPPSVSSKLLSTAANMHLLRSRTKLIAHRTALMKFHDELADLKSHFDGHGDFDAKTLG